MKIFKGKPLIEWTLIACQELRFTSEVFVSTDDSSILALAHSYGFIPLKRPKNLCSSLTPMTDVILHVLNKVDSSYTHVLLLQPTSPLRQAKDIRRALKIFKQNQGKSLFSVIPTTIHPEKMLVLKNGLLKPYVKNACLNANIQNLKTVYKQNGAIYIFEIKEFRKKFNLYQTPCIPFLMKEESSIDVDTLIDFRLAEIFFTK